MGHSRTWTRVLTCPDKAPVIACFQRQTPGILTASAYAIYPDISVWSNLLTNLYKEDWAGKSETTAQRHKRGNRGRERKREWQTDGQRLTLRDWEMHAALNIQYGLVSSKGGVSFARGALLASYITVAAQIYTVYRGDLYYELSWFCLPVAWPWNVFAIAVSFLAIERCSREPRIGDNLLFALGKDGFLQFTCGMLYRPN